MNAKKYFKKDLKEIELQSKNKEALTFKWENTSNHDPATTTIPPIDFWEWVKERFYWTYGF